MADEVFVLNEGQVLPTDFTAALSTGTFNTATSTNPFVVTKSSSHSTSENFNYYEVYDAEVSSFGGTTTAINTTSTTNAQETPGYRVQLDTGNANGFTIDTNYHYFVLVYSDSIYKHHFAKYTEQTKYDGTVYNIDFTPRLKENIPVGTQVKIFKGPLVSSSIVAAGYGLINNTATSEERHDKFVELSRPTFYFLSGDKLEPNRKYSIVKRLISGSNTVNSFSFFKTAPLTSDYILDKSFFTQNATIVDNNKTLDNASTPQLRNTSSGTGATYTFSTTTWNDSSRNIYYSDSGHTTYLGFIDSPVRNQLIPNAINIKTNKTLTNRGNYFEAKFSDVTKFLDKKVNTNERVQVKEGIKRQNITYLPQATLYGTYNNHTDSDKIEVTGLADGQDLRTLLFNSSSSKYEVILIGDYYYLPSAIAAPSSGSQVITIANRRAITSQVFEGSTTVASMTNATAFRKEWSAVVSNFITTHPIDTIIESGTLKRNGIDLTDSEADINGLEYRIDGEYYGFSITVKNGDSVNGYVAFSDSPSSSYYASTDLFSSLKGKLDVNKIVYEGRVETIEKKIENNLHFITLSGRDDMSKLLSSPVNKNYTYSKEYIYSCISPFTDGFTDTGVDIDNTNENDQSLIDVTGTLSVALKFGDVLYVKFGSRYIMVGVSAGSYSGTVSTIQLLNGCLIDTFSSLYFGINSSSHTIGDLYVANKKLLAGKSINTSLRNSGTTTLFGSLDKGYRLLGRGNFLTNAGNALDTQTMFSFNGDGQEIDGLLVAQGSSINRKDSPLGFDFTKTDISSLTEFEYIGSTTNENTGLLEVQLGYVSPIVLGRIDNNSDDTFYDQSMGLHLINANGLSEGGFLHLLNNFNVVDASSPIQYSPNTYKNIIIDDRNDSTRVGANYSMRFGSPIFRYNNLNKSTTTFSRKLKTNAFGSNVIKNKKFNLFQDNPSAYNFYSSVFRVEGNVVVDVDFHDDGGDSNLKELSVEKTGYYPAVGSIGQDIKYFPTAFKNSTLHFGPRTFPIKSIYGNKEFYEIDDPHISNVFLFSAGDALPETVKRYDNIFNSTISRNTSDYFLLVKYQSPNVNSNITHDNYTGNSETKAYVDTDYEYFPIENNASKPKRMNLLRLRSMTVDANLNEVDFEKYTTSSSFNDSEHEPSRITNSVPNNGLGVYPCHTASATSTSSTTISVDSVAGIYKLISGSRVAKFLYTNPADDSTGYSQKIGEVSSVNSGSNTITLTANALVAYSGEIYVADGTTAAAAQSGSRYKNAENYVAEGTLSTNSSPHNPNIHQISGSTITLNNSSSEPTIESEMSGTFQKFLYNNWYHTVTNLSGSSPNARITFQTHNGVAPVLTNYTVGGQVTLSGHTTSAFNQTYTITAVNSDSLDVDASSSVASETADSSFVASILSSNIYRYPVRVEAIRLKHDYATQAQTSFPGSIGTNFIYTGMQAVVVKNGEINNFSADYPEISTAKNTGLMEHNNYGTTITASRHSPVASNRLFTLLTTSDNYFGDTNASLTGSGDSNLEKNHAEILFVPVIDLSFDNVSIDNGTGTSGQYVGGSGVSAKTYIQIDFDPDEINTNIAAGTNGQQRWIHYIGSLAGKYLVKSGTTNDGSLHYILNHHISKRETDGKFMHYLEIDNYYSGLGGTDKFTLMTVCSQTTQMDKRRIFINNLSQTNVINPLTNKFYTRETPERDWTTSTLSDTNVKFENNEAIVKGMYVLADPDGMSPYLVHRDDTLFRTSSFFQEGTYSVCLTDGINKITTEMEVDTDTAKTTTDQVPFLYFNDMTTLRGSVSIGEVFNLQVIGKINRPVKSVKIVRPFDIQNEVEEIADDILSSIGLTYNKSQDHGTVNHSKYYIGSNFDGQDSFSAINSVLDYADLRLNVDGESFSIVSNETDKDYRSIQLTEDTTEYNITSFKRDVSLYDKFNSVVVIGDNVRGIARNHSEIRADGSEKVKEIYDFSITGQTQADEKARKMLKAFSTLSNAIQIEVASDIPHIEPGQIIELKFEREGIFRGDYVVIEVSKESGFPTKLLLGEYTKDLSATLSLLLGETRNLQGRNKQVYKSYASPSISLQMARLKFVKATITKNAGASTTVLGFGSTIGFDMGMGL